MARSSDRICDGVFQNDTWYWLYIALPMFCTSAADRSLPSSSSSMIVMITQLLDTPLTTSPFGCQVSPSSTSLSIEPGPNLPNFVALGFVGLPANTRKYGLSPPKSSFCSSQWTLLTRSWPAAAWAAVAAPTLNSVAANT